jgi:phage gpG-like protein
MGASFKVDMSFFTKYIDKLDNPASKQKIERIPQDKGIAALIGQAIADNFAKQGPGWKQLKIKTIRESLRQSLQKQAGKMTDAQLRAHERKAKKKGTEPYRMILQRTGLLKKTATIPGFAGNNKNATGGNIYKVEGNNIVWGTDLSYAAIHNQGNPSKHIPKREFLVIRDEWKKILENYVLKKYENIINNTVRP